MRLVAGLQPGTDEVAFYSFDTSLHEVREFSTTFAATEGAWHATKAYGATSLWDAIAETAQKISDRQRRRALVVITDGVDSASTLKPSDVSAIASSLDVPVYIARGRVRRETTLRVRRPIRGPMADLAAWTGGDSIDRAPRTRVCSQQRANYWPSSIINILSRSSRAARRVGTRSCCEPASQGCSSVRAAATW